MTTLYTIEQLNDPNCPREPVRLLKYRIIFCAAGNAKIRIDQTDFTMCAAEVITITSGQIHYFTALNGQLTIVDFPLEFICKDDHDIELIFHNGLFCHFGENELIKLHNSDDFSLILHKIEDEIKNRLFQYQIAVKGHIESLLITINRTKIARGDSLWKPDALFLKFLELTRNSFIENYSVADYARLLQTNEAKLNELSKLHTSKTAQNVIFSLKISEAKRLLLYQDFTIKEISYKLGFTDPFYFSNFFKKHTGKSPKDYKASLKVLHQ